jgi:C1A family cysteine protease
VIEPPGKDDVPMFKGVSRRLVASLVLGTAVTSLTACSLSSQPMMAPATGLTGAYAARSADSETRVFNLKFDAKRAPIQYVAPHPMRGISASSDLRPKLSPVQNQGRLGACTGFAAEGLAEYWERQGGNTEQLSPGFIYSQELKEDGNPGQDAGSYISTAIDVLKTYGACPEAMHPYIAAADQTDPAKIRAYLSTEPSAEAFKAALANRIKTAAQIRDLDGFKKAIAAGKPVIFGIVVYKSFMNPEVKTTGVVPMPASNEQRLGGHAILAVGYDDAKQQVLFRNSWSEKWGDKGYGYLPYTYFKSSLVHDAWSAN